MNQDEIIPGKEYALREPPRPGIEVEHVRVVERAVLADSAVHVARHTGDVHICLINEPPVPDCVTTRPRCVDQQRGEALGPTGTLRAGNGTP